MNDTLIDITTEKSLQVGAIWVSTFGYEACIADFFVVTRVSGSSLWLAPIAKTFANGNNWQGDECWPILPHVTTGPEKRHVLNLKRRGLRVKYNEYASIYPWGGSKIHTYNHH